MAWLEAGVHIKAVADLLGHSSIAITGDSEAEVIGRLTQTIRQSVRDMIIDGKPVPKARTIDDLPITREGRRLHRMLLVIG